jgi:hypothetical protein
MGQRRLIAAADKPETDLRCEGQGQEFLGDE